MSDIISVVRCQGGPWRKKEEEYFCPKFFKWSCLIFRKRTLANSGTLPRSGVFWQITFSGGWL